MRLKNIESLIDGNGDITIRRVGPIPCAAIACGEEQQLAAQVRQVNIIPVERLDYVEAQDDYVAIHSDGRTWLKTQPLAELAQGLDPARFVRIHRSYVLNVERLAKLELYSKDSRIAILKDGKQLPVSRAGYVRLKELM